ncbi:MAG TPA: cob(I)yrinic acid a,c-diamide adenosyltransferase [Capsulimonadaceae bacterium]|nr:cob(I)yrinic acid a,c-diamide adenosyltransferase [Capsulimonadaceae bacterium]
MKIYTRTGDGGQTGLFGGQRVEKDSARVQAYGAIDELNAALGWAHTQVDDPQAQSVLTRIQNDLLVAGADLATPVPKAGSGQVSANIATIPRIDSGKIRRLEEEIDRFEAELPELTNFILPGGSRGGAALHMARAVCRRAERHLVSLFREEPINDETLRYINRLSDHLFVLARLVNHRAGAQEAIWSRDSA